MGNSKFDLYKYKAASFGAAVVVTGALFKIMHWPGGELMLILGLSTEALIFVIYGMGKPGMDYAWEKVYPELSQEDAVAKVDVGAVKKRQKDTIESLEGMPVLDVDMAKSLKTSLENLTKSSGQITDVNAFTNGLDSYSEQLKTGTDNLSALNAAYEVQLTQSKENYDASRVILDNLKGGFEQSSQLSESLSGLSRGLENYSEKLKTGTDNLSALNDTYESQHAQSKENYNASRVILESLKGGLEQSNQLAESLSGLNQNIQSLGSIYGGMLNAISNKG